MFKEIKTLKNSYLKKNIVLNIISKNKNENFF